MTANVPVKAARQAPAQPVLNVFAPLHREIDRLFEDFAPNFPGFRSGLLGAPEARCRMDLAETKAGLEMTIELPGLEEKDIDVSVSDGLLTVSGEKKIESEKADKNYRFVERSYGAFSRSLQLPAGVEAEQIKASLDKGVLRVVIPTPAKAEPKKITVKAAG